MGAQRLSIEAKRRENPIALVRLDDFEYREGGDVDPKIVVEQPAVSLYYLDHDSQRAIFVETPPAVDLSQAPFYYQAQYEAAQSLIAVPYETLHQLARDIAIDPQRLILMYSTGRCGSTLVSRAINQADGVYSFSEPDVYTQLVALREPDGSNDAEVSDLVRDCTKIMCAAASTAGISTWALKFRSFGIELGHLFFRQFPEAKVVFLYRNVEGYARSSARAFRIFEPESQEALPYIQQAFSRLVPLIGVYTATHTTTIPAIEMLVCMWVAVMERCLDLQQQGVPMFCARYEDLKVAPYGVLDAMFSYCGLVVSDPAALDRVLVQDSQAGTDLSQANAEQSSSILTEGHVQEIHRLLRHYAPHLASDSILPHTFLPQRS